MINREKAASASHPSVLRPSRYPRRWRSSPTKEGVTQARPSSYAPSVRRMYAWNSMTTVREWGIIAIQVASVVGARVMPMTTAR